MKHIRHYIFQEDSGMKLTTAAVTCLMVATMGSANAAHNAHDIDRRCPGAEAWTASQHEKSAGSGAVNAAQSQQFSDPQFRELLLQRSSDDQQARDAWISSNDGGKKVAMEAMLRVDASNLAWLKSQIDTHGVPNAAQVGKEGMQALWTLVQHADSDPAFQQRMLVALAPRLATNDISPDNFAMLTDRVLRQQGKPQRYGSQFMPDPANPKKMVMQPTEDVAHLDQRRATMHLMPMKDYRCVLTAVYEQSR